MIYRLQITNTYPHLLCPRTEEQYKMEQEKKKIIDPFKLSQKAEQRAKLQSSFFFPTTFLFISIRREKA